MKGAGVTTTPSPYHSEGLSKKSANFQKKIQTKQTEGLDDLRI